MNYNLPRRDSIFDNPIHEPLSTPIQFNIENINCLKNQANSFKIYKDKRDNIFGYQGNIGFDLSIINNFKLISQFQNSKLVNDQYLFINKFDNLSKIKFDTLEFQINTNNDDTFEEVLKFHHSVITNIVLNSKVEDLEVEFDFIRPTNTDHQAKELVSFNVFATKDQNVRLVNGSIIKSNKAIIKCYNKVGQFYIQKKYK